MKLAAVLVSLLMLLPAQAQEKTFTMGSLPRNDRLIPHVHRSAGGTSIHFEQPARFGPTQLPPLIYGLSAVNLQPERKNLLSNPYVVPNQAFVGSHPWGQPAAGGAVPGFGWRNQVGGPLMPFYGGGVGVVLGGDDGPQLWGW